MNAIDGKLTLEILENNDWVNGDKLLTSYYFLTDIIPHGI